MRRDYFIDVKNNSGLHQTYAIFQDLPEVGGTLPGKIWPAVGNVLRIGPDSSSTWGISNRSIACCGFLEASARPNVNVIQLDTNEADLGEKKADGSFNPGQSFRYTGIAVEYDRPSNGQIGAFEIKTSGHLSVELPIPGGEPVIGLACHINDYQVDTAVFTPQPNASYQIKPRNCFWVAYGNFEPACLVDWDSIRGNAVKVDFSVTGNYVVVTHDNTGKLSIQQR